MLSQDKDVGVSFCLGFYSQIMLFLTLEWLVFHFFASFILFFCIFGGKNFIFFVFSIDKQMEMW